MPFGVNVMRRQVLYQAAQVRIAQAAVTEEQGTYQQHSAWGCSRRHL